MPRKTRASLYSLDLPAEIAKSLGGSPEAENMAADPGLHARALRIGGHGPGRWAPMPAHLVGRFGDHLATVICPGEERLIGVTLVASRGPDRVVASFELVRGVRVTSCTGRTMQLKPRTSGVLVVGPPNPAEDLVDIQVGLAAGGLLLFCDTSRPRFGLLLAAKPTPGSSWWPSRPRTGPRPKRNQ